MSIFGRTSSLLLSLSCILIVYTFDVQALKFERGSFKLNIEEENLLPMKDAPVYSMYDIYKNSQSFINENSEQQFSELGVDSNYKTAYDINLMDVDLDARRRRAVNDDVGGSGDIYECKDVKLNNCTGKHVQCIELDDGFECGCDDSYKWDSKEWVCYKKLYPHGSLQGATSLDKNDDATAKLEIKSGIPFYQTKHTAIYIGSNGILSFGKKFNPTEIEFPLKDRSVLCPYCSDVDTSGTTASDADISFRLYDKNSNGDAVTKVLDRANADVVKYSTETSFDAAQVVVITWYKVPKYGSTNPQTEVATFQAVIVTDGETTYLMYIYNELNWKPSLDRITIGYAENAQNKQISVSGTRSAYSLKSIGGARGESGFYVFHVGYVQSFSQKCMNWYTRNKREYEFESAKYKKLPKCPCSTKRLGSDRRWGRMFGGTSGVKCVDLNYIKRFLPKGKKCCYRDGKFISSGGDAGYAYRFHPRYSWIQSLVEDAMGKLYCCEKSNLCDKFYKLRPTGECSSKSEFQQGGGFGDPHIGTLDGNTFIFNGHGEYTLISIADADYTFDVQARTGRAITSNGTETTATIFTAFAAKEGASRFHVELSPDKSKIYVFGNDESGGMKDYTQLFNDNDINDPNSFITDPTLSNLVITKSAEGDITVAFPSGNSLTVKQGPKLLTIDASIHTKYKTKTKGLLGDYDGNKDNDFVFPNGTTLTSSSEETIYYYSQTWMITAANSVMKYPLRESADDYNFPDFKPMFLDQAPDALRTEANKVCGGEGNIACIFDYVATGNKELAEATSAKKEEADATQAELANSIPVIQTSGSTSSLDITKGAAAVTFTLHGTDEDSGDSLTYEFTGKIPNGVTFNLDSQSGVGTISTTTMDSISLRFVVKDTKGAYSSEYQINVRLCDGCSGHGTCVFSESRSSLDSVETNDAFLVAKCDCSTGYTDDDCSKDYNACDEKPCIQGQDCTDLTPDQEKTEGKGYQCSACPTGFEEKNGKCADIDECAEANKCPQDCENTAGSFICRCRSGFKKIDDKCQDVNECEIGTHSCEQTCTNTNGLYTCSCMYGFELNSDQLTCTQTASDCNVKTGGKECVYGCIPAESGANYVCSCKSGYKLNADDISCDNVDECQLNICVQKCIDTVGSYVCSCYDGYKLAADKRSCDPCTDLSYGPQCGLTCDCGDRASKCDSVQGCICNAGWKGVKCDENVNECEENPNICGSNMLCVDSVGSYVCNCPTGFEKNGTSSCIDINECEGEANTCVQDCTNVPGSFSCSCRSGFQGENCTDVDECKADQHECEQVCSNVVGSYNCECQFGYRLKEDRKTCEKVKDVCSLFPDLHCEHGCSVDDKNEAYCFCNTGFKLASDGEQCLDIDECTTTDAKLIHKCNHTCINKDAGYDCSCPTGYKLQNDRLTCLACDSSHWGDNCVNTCECGIGASSCNSETGCQCKTGWRGLHCDEDINECNGDVTCPTNSVCENTPGSYYCKCNDGYRMNGDSTACENIDECTDKLHNCDQICTDKPGSFVCSCNPGFVWTEATKQCKDVDECQTGNYECDHICVNTVGGYDCACRGGFKLDVTNKKTCIVKTTCTRTDCDSTNGGCANDGTTESCFCNKGFLLKDDDKTCEDVKECSADPGPCDTNGQCTEEEGSYSCSCNAGYKLQTDKVSCRECDEGKYGTECQSTCACSDSNTQLCNKATGACDCKPGWEGTTCETDIDECQTKNCGTNGNCRNVDGSYFCDCDSGFFRSDEVCKACDDKHWGINCAKTCTCTVNAESCSASDGSCTCKPGWEGTNCETDTNECNVNATICSGTAHSDCKNTDGSFSCDCQSGYTKVTNGTCQDIDECLEGSHNCDDTKNLKCFNTDGSFKCDCKPGYTSSGNGQCTAVKKYDAVIKLDYTLQNTDSNSKEYKDDEKRIKKALTDYFIKAIIGFLEVLIRSLKPGSTIVKYDIVVNSEVQKEPASSVTKAILDLEKEGNITMDDSIKILSQQLQNKNITTDTTLCSLYRDTGNCPDVQRCEVIDGAPKCTEIKSEDNLQLIIGLSVGIPLFFLVMGAIAVIVYMCMKSKWSRKGDDSSSEHDPTYQDQPFRSVFASSLPRRSHFGESNMGYNPDTTPFDSWGKRDKALNGKNQQMDFHSGPPRDDNRRNFSWDFLLNVLPQEPFELKRPKVSLSPNPASPSFKRAARHNEAYS